MFNKGMFIFIFILTLNNGLYAQWFNGIRITGQYNFFSFTDIRGYQSDLNTDLHNNNIPSKIVENIPPYFGVQLQYVFPAKFLKYFDLDINTNLGLYFDFASSGGRIHYSDYSGEMRIDNLIRVYSIGILFEFENRIKDNIYLIPGIKIPFIYSTLNNSFIIKRGYNEQNDYFDFNSITIGFEPNINLYLKQSDFVSGINLGYLFCIPADYTYIENSKAFLTRINGDHISTGTTGIRIGITIGYFF